MGDENGLVGGKSNSAGVEGANCRANEGELVGHRGEFGIEER